MRRYIQKSKLAVLLLGTFILETILCDDQQAFLEPPSVLLSIISRNEEHTLATYLGYIEKQDYPKDRISIL